MMALDDVVSSTVTGPRVEEAMWRTLRWFVTSHLIFHSLSLT